MDPQLMSVWQDTALKAGLVTAKNVNNATALGAAWDTAVKEAVMIAAATGGKTLMTPFEVAKRRGETTGAQLLATQSMAQARGQGSGPDIHGNQRPGDHHTG